MTLEEFVAKQRDLLECFEHEHRVEQSRTWPLHNGQSVLRIG